MSTITHSLVPEATEHRRRTLAVLGSLVALFAIAELASAVARGSLRTAIVGGVLLIVLAIILAARRLADASRASALVAAAALIVGVVVGLLFPGRGGATLAPLVAFALLLPYARGRSLAIAAAISLGAMAVIALAPVLLHQPDPEAPPEVTGAISVLGLLAAAVVTMLLMTTQRREFGTLLERHQQLLDALPTGVVRSTPDGRLLDVNAAFVELLGYPSREALLAVPVSTVYADPADRESFLDRIETDGAFNAELHLRRLDGSTIWVRQRSRPVLDSAGHLLWYSGVSEDITAEQRSGEVSQQLAAIVEAADDAIIGTAPGGIVTSWNAAAERTYGFSAAEMLGTFIGRIVPPDRLDELATIISDLANGRGTHGLDTERLTADGRRIAVSLAISPVFGPDGIAIGGATIARDITEQRALEDRLDRWARERSTTLGALRRLVPGETSEATADAVCRVLSTTDGFANATILTFEAADTADILGASSNGVDIDVSVSAMSSDRVRALRERADGGPWIDEPRRLGLVMRHAVDDRDVRAAAFVPLEAGGRAFGVLVVTTQRAGRAELMERLPALDEFAIVASALLAPTIASRHRRDRLRDAIRERIDRGAFSPVFQPIVDLASGAVLGYEALTRFDDGVPTELVFTRAASCGLGSDLEAATLERALDAAGPLRPDAFLNVNVSPEMVLEGTRLGALLAGSCREIVLEITEHAPVTDYESFRTALAALGSGMRLAVDDAGAGYSTFRHILELRPAFVKLDRGLVAGIDQDATRQALVAGMRHFAERTGCVLIAEGVETDAECAALRRLSVNVGQGHRFGRPVPVSDLIADRIPEPVGAGRGLRSLAGVERDAAAPVVRGRASAP